MARYRLTIAYDGTEFHGWQKQQPPASMPLGSFVLGPAPGGEASPPGAEPGVARVDLRTVQEVVERAVREVVHHPVTVIGASRTDAGVHAKHQTAAYTVPDEVRGPPIERLAMAINSRLPEDVLVTRAARAEEDFDPVFDAVAKGYRYTIHDSRERPLWDRRYVHHCWQPVDAAAMNEAAAALAGEHDFAAFAAAGHGRGSTVRTVVGCRVVRLAPDRVAIDVAADGFLWNMVRIIAGTLLEVGRGKMSAAEVAAALESKDRSRAGPTLPPEGLCLEWAYYHGDDPVDGRHGVRIPRELIDLAEARRAERRRAAAAGAPPSPAPPE